MIGDEKEISLIGANGYVTKREIDIACHALRRAGVHEHDAHFFTELRYDLTGQPHVLYVRGIQSFEAFDGAEEALIHRSEGERKADAPPGAGWTVGR